MKTLTNLSATIGETNFVPVRISTAIFHDKDGLCRHARLGGQGLMLACGKNQIAIPLEELFALAEKSDPEGFLPNPENTMKVVTKGNIAEAVEALKQKHAQRAAARKAPGAGASLALLFGLFCFPSPAAAQPQIPRHTAFIQSLTVAPGTNGFTTATNPMQLYRARGLSLSANIGTTNVNSIGSNMVARFQFSYDGTNYQTSPILYWTFLMPTNGGFLTTNFSADFCQGFQKLRMLDFTNNASNAIFVTNIFGHVSP